MTIALLHAYRAANRGDGWLVELSRELVREATGSEPVIFALDPQGMGPHARPVFHRPQSARAGASALLSATRATGPVNRALLDLPRPGELRAAIGIGGGYLRSNDPMHELVFRAHHLPQLRLLAAMGRRGAYLPVSVGPFRRGLGRTVRRTLGGVAWVGARDDRSARYLQGWANGWRLPDLAACRVGVERPTLRTGDPNVIGVALRSLTGSEVGLGSVSLLENRGFKARFGIQSSSGRTNDDRTFYRNRGVLDEAEDFGALLDDDANRPGVILAGRLHAALDAIAAGYPTIHLGYERKSAGAFHDLGLSDWVFDAWTSQPSAIADAAEALAKDPEPYWERLASRFDSLNDSWERLGTAVERLASGPAGRARF